MGTITSSVGLISGINTGAIINALINADSGPLDQVQSQNQTLTAQETAYQAISAQLLALQAAANTLSSSDTFNANTVTSSNQNAITGTATSTAAPGTYNFSVKQLVSTQQTVTKGFADTGSTPVGAGTLTFEFGNSGVSNDTPLSQLNGGNGVNRGEIRITDRSGATALVDLSQALTVGDVINDINNTSGINVTASLNGNSIQLTDNTGLTTAPLTVANVGSTGTATGLGLTGPATGATLTGSQVNILGNNTLLSTLNDGTGVSINGAQPDFQVSRRDGNTFDVNLTGATTIGDVINDINTASGGTVTAQVNSAGTGLQLIDSSIPDGSTLKVSALNGSTAAQDLGIAGEDTGNTGQITGTAVLASLGSVLLKELNGGGGVQPGVIQITNRAGTATQVDLSQATSLSDIISDINAAGTGVTASVNSSGDGIALTDTTGSTASNLIVSDVSGTSAAQLQLAQSVSGDTIDSGNLNAAFLSDATPLSALNGGSGVALGSFTITDGNGQTATVNLSTGADSTIGQVLANINSRGLAINAHINADGNGIEIDPTGAGGSTPITVADTGSTTAADLGIAGTASAAGQPLNGSFSKTVTISSTDTLTDVANAINKANIGVSASIIDDGSGNDPYRLSLQSTQSGEAGAFLLNDGGLGLGATTLVQAQNAEVFYGSTNAASAIPVTSTTNTLTNIIPGASISLLSTTTSPVQVSITQDTSSISSAVQNFVTAFNSVTSSLDQYDSYDATTQTAGVLFGDPTVESIKAQMFNYINTTDPSITGTYNSLASIGITASGSDQISFNSSQLTAALAANPAAVNSLFTLNQTTTNPVTNAITTTAAGVGVNINNWLKSLTDPSTGTLQDVVNTVQTEITNNNSTITQYQTQLNAQKAVLQEQFNQMEESLASLKDQSSALTAFANGQTTTSTSSSSSSTSSA